MHSQIYRNGLKIWISNVKIYIDNCDWLISGSHITQFNKINEGESNRKLPKMFADKNLRTTQKWITGKMRKNADQKNSEYGHVHIFQFDSLISQRRIQNPFTHHKETNRLAWTANQLNGFYMINNWLLSDNMALLQFNNIKWQLLK